MRWPYEQIGVTTARAFRNLLNKIIGDIGADMQEHKDRADNIQAQVDNLVADGDSSPEAAQARVGADGTNYTTLKQRLDAENQSVTAQLAEIENDNELTKNERINYEIRHANKGLFQIYNKPVEFADMPITILSDGRNFSTSFEVADFKHVGGTTYYVDPVNGNNANDGLTEETAVKRVLVAYQKCVKGDTIIMLDGVYSRDTWFSTTKADNKIEKSINIIAKNSGKVIVKGGDDHTFTRVSETDVYSTSRSNVLGVFDITGLSDEVTLVLNKVNTLEECTNTENTWFQDGETLYVHMIQGSVPTNDNLIVQLATGVALVNTACESESVELYLEGITFIGGGVGTCHIRNSADYLNPKLYAKNCVFKHGYSTDVAFKDGVSLLGCQGYFQNCTVAYSNKDGFNYHSYNGVTSNGIEINCKAYGNGLGWSDLTCNGSTAHDGGKVIRINGLYYNNYGANVADVGVGTTSLNLRCIAYDSMANSKDGFDADFTTQQAGAKMYLDNCKAFGSHYSIRAVPDSIIVVNKTDYSTIELN